MTKRGLMLRVRQGQIDSEGGPDQKVRLPSHRDTTLSSIRNLRRRRSNTCLSTLPSRQQQQQEVEEREEQTSNGSGSSDSDDEDNIDYNDVTV